MAEKIRLIGADATLERGTLGTLKTTGAATKGDWYIINAINGTTVFPSEYKVGDIWQGDATKTFSATNSAYPITFAVAEDVSSWEVTLLIWLNNMKKKNFPWIFRLRLPPLNLKWNNLI